MKKLLAFVGLGALLLVLGLPVLTFPPGRDQGLYACVGRGILEGSLPYRDLWDFRPPGVYYAHAALFRVFGARWAPVPALHLGVQIATALVLMTVGRRWFGAFPGFMAGLLYGVLALAGQGCEAIARPESLYALPAALSLLFLPSKAPGSRLRLLACGMAVGAAVAVHGAAILLLPLYCFALRKSGGRAASRFALPAGVLAIPLLTLLYFGLRFGMGDLVYATVVFASRYAVMGLGAPVAWAGEALRSFGSAMVNHILLFLPCVLLGMALPAPEPEESRARPREALVLVAAAALIALGLLQAGRSPHALLAAMPFLALGAGQWFGRFWARLGPVSAGRGAVAMAGLVLLLGSLNADLWLQVKRFPAAVERLAAGGDEASYVSRWFPPAEGRGYLEALPLSRRLAALSGPQDKVLIWGFEPVAYFLSGARPAARFLTPLPLVVPFARPSLQARMLDDVKTAAPRFLVVYRDDAMPEITGRNEDSEAMMRLVPGLLERAAQAYGVELESRNFLILAPRDAVGPPAAPDKHGEWKP